MRLKREFQELKKQVSQLKKKEKIYKWKDVKPKVEVSSVATQSGLIE